MRVSRDRRSLTLEGKTLKSRVPAGCVSFQKILGKTGRGRNRQHVSLKPYIHRVVDRRAHGIAADSGGVCKGRRYVRAEIMILRISNGRRRIRAYRGFNGSAARA